MNSLMLENESGIITDPKILSHLRETIKPEVGQNLRCAVLNKGLCKAQIISLTENECHMKLGPLEPPVEPWFELVVGLSRPQTLKKILEHATTFGAKKIHFFKAELSEKSYLTSKVLLDEDEMRSHLLAGLSQSGRYSILPTVKVDKYNPAEQYVSQKQKFILDLEGAKNFTELSKSIDFSGPITLAIGPERGFIKEDIQRFHQAGFKSVKVSSSILRVEHAIYSAISQLELTKGQF